MKIIHNYKDEGQFNVVFGHDPSTNCTSSTSITLNQIIKQNIDTLHEICTVIVKIDPEKWLPSVGKRKLCFLSNYLTMESIPLGIPGKFNSNLVSPKLARFYGFSAETYFLKGLIKSAHLKKVCLHPLAFDSLNNFHYIYYIPNLWKQCFIRTRV